eukprot:4061119-Amphidinium_carterae.1
MATLEALTAQLQALQGELQQQHNRMQAVEAENAQLRANGLGALYHSSSRSSRHRPSSAFRPWSIRK